MIRFAILSALLLPVAASAATISISVSNAAGVENSGTVNLTTQGSLDWWAFASDNEIGTITPSNRKAIAGIGSITSTTTGGTATALNAAFNNASNDYNWTDGSPTAVGTQINNFDRINMPTGATFTVVTNVSQAGSYTLKIYSAVVNVDMTATASLTTAGISATPRLSDVPDALHNNYWTVDFTTDGADTLTTVLTSSGSNNIFAIEAIALTVPEPSSALLLGFAAIGLCKRRRR